eukprot:scaffold303_cov410-Prasinococcus_capsulatus_cf.AAC.7
MQRLLTTGLIWSYLTPTKGYLSCIGDVLHLQVPVVLCLEQASPVCLTAFHLYSDCVALCLVHELDWNTDALAHVVADVLLEPPIRVCDSRNGSRPISYVSTQQPSTPNRS